MVCDQEGKGGDVTNFEVSEKIAAALFEELKQYAEELPARFADITKSQLPEGQTCIDLIKGLTPLQRQQLPTLLRWAVIDTASITLHMIEGSTVIDDFRGDFELTWEGHSIGHYLADDFLAADQNDRRLNPSPQVH